MDHGQNEFSTLGDLQLKLLTAVCSGGGGVGKPPRQLVVQRAREAAVVDEPCQAGHQLPSPPPCPGVFPPHRSLPDLANCLTGELVSRLDSLQRGSSTEAPEGL